LLLLFLLVLLAGGGFLLFGFLLSSSLVIDIHLAVAIVHGLSLLGLILFHFRVSVFLLFLLLVLGLLGLFLLLPGFLRLLVLALHLDILLDIGFFLLHRLGLGLLHDLLAHIELLNQSLMHVLGREVAVEELVLLLVLFLFSLQPNLHLFQLFELGFSFFFGYVLVLFVEAVHQVPLVGEVGGELNLVVFHVVPDLPPLFRGLAKLPQLLELLN